MTSKQGRELPVPGNSLKRCNDSIFYDVSPRELCDWGVAAQNHVRCIRAGHSGNTCEGLKRSGRSSA
jgi:hypothetical protein